MQPPGNSGTQFEGRRRVGGRGRERGNPLSADSGRPPANACVSSAGCGPAAAFMCLVACTAVKSRGLPSANGFSVDGNAGSARAVAVHALRASRPSSWPGRGDAASGEECPGAQVSLSRQADAWRRSMARFAVDLNRLLRNIEKVGVVRRAKANELTRRVA